MYTRIITKSGKEFRALLLYHSVHSLTSRLRKKWCLFTSIVFAPVIQTMLTFKSEWLSFNVQKKATFCLSIKSP